MLRITFDEFSPMKYFYSCLFSFLVIFQPLSAQEIPDAKIDSILSLLTLEEKVAMCHAQSKFSTPGVPRLGIPEVWMSDGPHGVRGEIAHRPRRFGFSVNGQLRL